MLQQKEPMSGGWKSSLEYPWPPKTHTDTVSPGIMGWRCWILPYLGIFPSRGEHSATSECPRTPKSLQHFYGFFGFVFFFRMDTVECQEGQVSLICTARVKKCGLSAW